MKNLIVLALLALPLPALASAPVAARCSVSGPAVYETARLQNLLVDAAGTRVIAIAMGERDGASGTYNTFAHLNLSLTDSALGLDVTSSGRGLVGVTRDPARPLWARLSFPSRLGRASLTVELSCERVALPYVLVPVARYDADPIYGVSYLATTVADSVRANPYIWPAQSRAEALAASTCVAGDAAAAAAEMMASPLLWRTDAQDHGTVLVPATVAVTAEGELQWEQRAQELVCTKSHLEKQYNSDTGLEEEVSVCDQLEKHELAPVTVTLPACAK